MTPEPDYSKTGRLYCPYYIAGQMLNTRIERLELSDIIANNCPECGGLDITCKLYNNFIEKKLKRILYGD